MSEAVDSRRPIKSRRRRWIRATAQWLSDRTVSPNVISSSSMVAAALASACFILLPRASGKPAAIALAIVAGASIQLRLLANVLDGLVAVEGGRQTPLGGIFNEVPDRVSDVLILVGAGYAITWLPGGWLLGWIAALAAVLTAYVRLLGGSLRLAQDFCGPMAKAQRMALLTVACLGSAVEAAVGPPRGYVIAAALALIAVGSLATCGRRLRRMAAAISSR